MTSKLDLPYDEGLARDVIAALQGNLFGSDFDPKTIPLEQALAPLDAGHGVRIYTITEGPGKHKLNKGLLHVYVPEEFNVPKGKVYATIDTISCLAGSCETYIFAREEGKLKLEERKLHARS